MPTTCMICDSAGFIYDVCGSLVPCSGCGGVGVIFPPKPKWNGDTGLILIQAGVFNKPMDSNPVFKAVNGWFFYDETWSNWYGPFESEEECKEECKKYARGL